MIKPAVVVVGYNRPESLKRLLSSIGSAVYNYDDIPLIISLDRSDRECDVVAVAKAFKWGHGEKTIRTFETRQGLKQHILQCGDLSGEYGAVIILEDDLYVARDFYNFTVEAINYYKDDDRVAGIGLYSHEWNGYANIPFQKRCGNADVFAGQFSITWGQCWSERQWNSFRIWLKDNPEFEFCDYIPERINRWSKQSWGKFFVKYIVASKKYYIIPNVSLSTNFSDVGQHSQNTNTAHQVQLWERSSTSYKYAPLEELFKYDIFFEPKLDTKELFNIAEKDIDIDLNQSRKRVNKKRYLLTTCVLPYKVLKRYSLSLRPIECNIIGSVEGEGIYLYDTAQIDIKPAKRKTEWITYNLRGYDFTQLIPYVVHNIEYIAKVKIRLLYKRIRK